MQKQSLPINAAGRLALWIYPRISISRFAGAPTVVEKTRSYEAPNFDRLPESSHVELEVWGGAVKLSMDGELRRIYTDRFEYITFPSEEQTRIAFLGLWKRIERLEAMEAVRKAIAEWHQSNGRVDRR